MSQIRPFQIAVPQEKIDRLNAKLALADFPSELVESGWDYGSPLADVKRIAKYWHNDFKWREIEARINRLSHFQCKVDVDGFETLDIHFLHHESKIQTAIPLLFVHGWPGSFLEVTKMLPDLLDGHGNHPAFHVVAPSLPGFAFSEATKKRGFTTPQLAEVCHKVMKGLGYDQYVTQGGDIGCGVTRAMGFLYPQSCKASHLTMLSTSPPTLQNHPELFLKDKVTPRTEADLAGFRRNEWFKQEGMAYMQLQSTKPQTLSYGVTDSPVGLLAWMYEKLHDWTDSYPWTDEEILTWVSLYYFSTAGPVAGFRIYYESRHDPNQFGNRLRERSVPDVKFGMARFPKELVVMPMLWNGTWGTVVHESDHEKGGHFSAWERPDALVRDLREMFGRGGGAYGVVPNKDGFL